MAPNPIQDVFKNINQRFVDLEKVIRKLKDPHWLKKICHLRVKFFLAICVMELLEAIQ